MPTVYRFTYRLAEVCLKLLGSSVFKKNIQLKQKLPFLLSIITCRSLKLADQSVMVRTEEEEVPNVEEEPVKKSRFTLEYLEQKLGRPLEPSEAEELTKLIGKGEDR